MEPTRISGPQGSQGLGHPVRAWKNPRRSKRVALVDPSAQGDSWLCWRLWMARWQVKGCRWTQRVTAAPPRPRFSVQTIRWAAARRIPPHWPPGRACWLRPDAAGSAVAGSVAGLAAGGGAMSGLADRYAAADGRWRRRRCWMEPQRPLAQAAQWICGGLYGRAAPPQCAVS